MATHPSVSARRLQGQGEPGGLPSMGVAQEWLGFDRRLSSSSSRQETEEYQSTALATREIKIPREPGGLGKGKQHLPSRPEWRKEPLSKLYSVLKISLVFTMQIISQ